MRVLVGPTNEAAFDNSSGDLVFPDLDESAYESVFGCGCGRVARQLLQQRVRPRRYVGIDLHRGMIQWCNENLAALAPEFEFRHHDVYHYASKPNRSRPDVLPFGVEDDAFTLVNAYSVFTHVTRRQAEYYLGEVGRILAPRGVLHSTWFFFDKRDFPALQVEHNALYVRDLDPGAAVLFDHRCVWRRRALPGSSFTPRSRLRSAASSGSCSWRTRRPACPRCRFRPTPARKASSFTRRRRAPGRTAGGRRCPGSRARRAQGRP